MKQPYILYEGAKRKVTSINWLDGKVVHVCFRDENDVFLTAFQSDKYFKEGFISGSLHLDLEKRITAE